MPDVGTDVSRIMDAKENILMHVKYRLKDSRTTPETVSLKTSTVEPRLSGLVGTSVKSPDNRESG